MSEFHVVDLVSQRDAVREHVRGRSEAEIVSWLATQGRLVREDVGGREVFVFETAAGRRATFFFDNAELVFVGDHATFM